MEKRREALGGAEASLAQQVSGSLNGENMGIGGKTMFGQWLTGNRLLDGWNMGEKSQKREDGTGWALDLWKLLLFPNYLQPNCRMNHFFHASLLPRCGCRWHSLGQKGAWKCTAGLGPAWFNFQWHFQTNERTQRFSFLPTPSPLSWNSGVSTRKVFSPIIPAPHSNREQESSALPEI